MIFPISDEFDQKKMQMRRLVQEKVDQAYVQVRINDLTSVESMFIRNPNQEIIEDRKVKENYTFKDIQMVLARSRIVLLYFYWFLGIDSFIFQYHYPKFSYYCFGLIMFAIYDFDPQYLLSYLVFIGGVVICAQSLTFQQNPWVRKAWQFFFSEEEKHEKFQNGNQIKKQEEFTYQNLLKQLTDDEAIFDDVNQFQQDYSVQQTKGLLNKYRDAKKGTANTLNIMDKYCDYFEKYKNLIQWEDSRMTKLAIIVLIIIFVIVTYLPIRLFLAIACIYKFYKGKNWHKKRVRNNREICKMELQNLFNDLKIDIDGQSREKQKKQAKADAPPSFIIINENQPLEDLEWQWSKIITYKQGKNAI